MIAQKILSATNIPLLKPHCRKFDLQRDSFLLNPDGGEAFHQVSNTQVIATNDSVWTMKIVAGGASPLEMTSVQLIPLLERASGPMYGWA